MQSLLSGCLKAKKYIFAKPVQSTRSVTIYGFVKNAEISNLDTKKTFARNAKGGNMSCIFCQKDEVYAKLTIQFTDGFVVANTCKDCFNKAKKIGAGACPTCKVAWLGSKYKHKCQTLNWKEGVCA